MGFERAEVMAAQNELRRERLGKIVDAAEQAAVSKEKLTNSPEWNIFLQELQKKLEEAETGLQALKDGLSDPGMPDSQVLSVRNTILIYTERVGTLSAIIALPSDVMKAGEDARLKLEELTVDGSS